MNLVVLYIGFLLIVSSAQAQLMIPFGFWRAQNPSLLISDGATYSYGNIAISTNVDKTFTITNSGAGPAATVTGAAFAGIRFTFKGGSFPGTAGTCGTALSPNGSCTIVVTANSATAATFSDTITVNYNNGMTASMATRAVTATFVSAPTQLAITSADFIKVSDCVAITITSQDSVGNPLNVAANTTVNLVINNATLSSFYTTNTCATTTTSTTIAISTNTKVIYFKSTAANQSGILIATATGLSGASKNVTITSAPTKLLLTVAPRMKITTCNSVTIESGDLNGYPSNVVGAVTVNLTKTGSPVYYSDAGCTASITSTTIAAGTNMKVVYIKDASIEVITATATDAAATLTADNRSINFATSLTWWNTGWAKRIRIDINNLDQATSFTDQPLLVILSSSVINYSDFKIAGADVRFVASDDTTQIDHEIEQWSTLGTSHLWVRVPSIVASTFNNYIYIYYNNPAAPDGQNKTGIWINFWAVWHLNENPTSTAPQYKDSTSNARNGTAMNSPAQTIGVIGKAADLNGTTDSVKINQDLSAVLGVTFTFSCWMKTAQSGNNTSYLAPGITGVEQAGGANDIFIGWLDAAGNISILAGNGAGANSSYVVNNNAWRHVTMTRDTATGSVQFYINGVLTSTATSEVGNKTTYFDLLGEIGNTGGAGINYNGLLDEVRIYNSVKSAAQIKADFKYMMNTHTTYNLTEVYP